MTGTTPREPVSLRAIVQAWGRIGCIGFGGPPTHIALLRDLCMRRNEWLSEQDFEDAVAACNLLPGPASTQLAIYCAWRLRGRTGALLGALAFILPGLVAIIALAALFLAASPPRWILGAGAGAGSAVAAVALQAGWSLTPASWGRTRGAGRVRWLLFAGAGALGAATLGPWLVLVLIACGGIELAVRTGAPRALVSFIPVPVTTTVAGGGLLALSWVALKVGALSFGGGFVIVPLMQADAVNHYHWLSGGQFLNAVALGQVTPGPVTQTVAVVGYAAAGVGGALLAALVAFAPSLGFIALGGRRFDRIRGNVRVRAFLDGSGPAAIGAILGSAVPLARALGEGWQVGVLTAAAIALLLLQRRTVTTLVVAALIGVIVTLSGGPLPHG